MLESGALLINLWCGAACPSLAVQLSHLTFWVVLRFPPFCVLLFSLEGAAFFSPLPFSVVPLSHPPPSFWGGAAFFFSESQHHPKEEEKGNVTQMEKGKRPFLICSFAAPLQC